LPYRLGSFWTDFLATNRERRWMRAESAGDSGPWRQQAILGRGRWDADALREIVREYALETLAEETAVLVVDETGFLKQGKASCGVATNTRARQARSPIARSACLLPIMSRHGYAFVDRELYLPKEWTDDADRLKAAHVPDEVGFATKPHIAPRLKKTPWP
jgi:SRSO17 transposase